MSSALLNAVDRYTSTAPGRSPYLTPIRELVMLRSPNETLPNYRIFSPALCVVLQGAKWAIFGGRRVDYRPGEAIVVSVEMPALARVSEATPEMPYIGLVLEFDLAIMREVMATLPSSPGRDIAQSQGAFVIPFDGALADCVLRLVNLLNTPEAIPVVRPLIMRELSYWLLTGPQGNAVAEMVLGTSHEQRIITAIHTLRARFTEPLRMEALAEIAHMSPSAFHRQFKLITAMTPLQYQKQLRLIEARRMMVADNAKVETAAFAVGYESPSQFSREYARMFGVPPRRDTKAIQLAPAAGEEV